MKIVLFCHSLRSDWNHGNAHFLRGIARELIRRGHDLSIYEQEDNWSRHQLIRDHGQEAALSFKIAYPELDSQDYTPDSLDIESILADVDLTLVHEWNPPDVIARIGEYQEQTGRARGHQLVFHDTHHRSVTAPEQLDAIDLRGYDGVLAFGQAVKEAYERHGWHDRVHVWHEAADDTWFRPLPNIEPEADLVWIGNWGDDERTAELHEFLLQPVKRLKLKANVYGVRYPEDAKAALADVGIAYHGYLPNVKVPEAFARHRVTVHVPRRPYVEALPGVPTIRPFEAMACGIPLVTSPWEDAEGLFTRGDEYLMASNGEAMATALDRVLSDAKLADDLATCGRRTILGRHSCRHRVNELITILAKLRKNTRVGR